MNEAALKPLLKVTREHAGSSIMLYLYYADPKGKVARTITEEEDGSLAIDLDSFGDVLGIELISPDQGTFRRLAEIARDRKLSLHGFEP